MRPLQAGSSAPAFTLPASERDAARSSASLTEFRGRPLVLTFYPADWSPVCGDQMALYNQVLPEIARHGANLVGISVDGTFCHQAFAEDRRLRFPLLADFEPKGRTAQEYGVYRDADGTSERALFVIDATGVIRWSHVSPIDINPGADGILQALSELSVPTDARSVTGRRDEPELRVVSLIEYGDYECTHCRKAHPIVQHVRTLFGDRLRFEYRHFPLSEIHPHALHAAQAAMSVHRHAGAEAFEAMHDAIFTHQHDGAAALDDAHLARYAGESGADPAQVLADLEAEAFADIVQDEFLDGVRLGVNGTPTFFIDGVRFDDDWRRVELLVNAIERASASVPANAR
jgi:peroxiredoxin/2-hydroxychromene-2-carboxylate isomerase